MQNKFIRKGQEAAKIPLRGMSRQNSCIIRIHPYKSANLTDLLFLSSSTEGGILGEELSTSATFETDKTFTIDNDVIACTITKHKSNPSGSFSFTLKQGKYEKGQTLPNTNQINYAKILQPGAWVTIWIKSGLPKDFSKDSSANSGLKLIGFIEDVSIIERDAVNGIPSLEYVVSGSDIGKVFLTDLFFSPVLTNDTFASLLGANLMADSKKLSKDKSQLMSPDEAVKKILSFALGSSLTKLSSANQTWFIPKTLLTTLKNVTLMEQKVQPAVVNILDINTRIGLHQYAGTSFTTQPLLGKTVFPTIPAQGTIWELLRFVQNPSMNELYVDLVKQGNELVASVVCRQYPFSVSKQSNMSPFNGKAKDINTDSMKTQFTSLPKHKINSADLLEKNIRKTNKDRINHISVVPEVVGTDVGALYMSMLNVNSIKKYGLKSVQFVNTYALDKNSIKSALYLLTDWFFKAHGLFKGRLKIIGPDDYFTIGNNLLIDDQASLFHIEGVTYEFRQNANGTNQYYAFVDVSHGIHADGNFLDFADLNEGSGTTMAVTMLENTKSARGSGG